MGRKIQSGIQKGNGVINRAALQTAFDGMTTETYEERGTALLGYTNRSFPNGYGTVDANVMQVIYYDDYTWNSDVNYNFDGAKAFHPKGLTKGMLTGMLSRNIETNDWYKSVNYYDYKGRNIQTFAQNHVGGIDRMEYQYRFNGEILGLRSVHKKTGVADLVEVIQYDLDHLGRKLRFRHNKDGISQTVASYNYNGIGQLSQKILKPSYDYSSVCTCPWTDPKSWSQARIPTQNDHVIISAGTDITIPVGEIANAGKLTFKGGILRNYGKLNLGNFSGKALTSMSNNAGETLIGALQTVDFKYHIRGNLLGINLDASNNTSTNNGDLFSMKLGYETDGYFDGNIGKQEWKSSLDNINRSFTYSYGGLNRILGANYSGNGNENYSLSNISYDANGNIKTLNRKGKNGTNSWGDIDQLSYVYQANSNKIQAVNDVLLVSNPNVGDFRDSSSIATQYTYNQDGSLNSDDNKRISFEWNYLKSPKKITKGSQWKKFIYNASGKLLQTITSTGKTTDFVGNLTYENNTLYQIAHDEGRIKSSGQYEYDINDHAKNLRLTFRDSLGIAKIVTKLDYDPWGYRLKGLDYYANYATYNKFKTFSGKQLHDDFGFNLLSYKFRFHDPALGRFISIDPLAEEYSHNSTFAFAENKLGLGMEYEGLELANFSSYAKSLKNGLNSLEYNNLSDGFGEIQQQQYTLNSNSKSIDFASFSNTFLSSPNKFLDTPAGSFSFAKQANQSTMTKGDILQIDPSMPVADIFVKVENVESTSSSLKVNFRTLQGHVEIGAIQFSSSYNSKTGDFSFNIQSTSRINIAAGAGPVEGFSRSQQSKVWETVLQGIQNTTKGTVNSSYETITTYKPFEFRQITNRGTSIGIPDGSIEGQKQVKQIPIKY